MHANNSSNNNSNELLEDNINILLENGEITLESEIEIKVVAASFSTHQEWEDDSNAISLDDNAEINRKYDMCLRIVGAISGEEVSMHRESYLSSLLISGKMKIIVAKMR